MTFGFETPVLGQVSLFSIPLNPPALQEAFLKFQDEVVRDAPNCRGMHQTLFQNPTLLHLTLGTMALLDDRERQLARDILEDCCHLILRFNF